jgi:hypothetical protein
MTNREKERKARGGSPRNFVKKKGKKRGGNLISGEKVWAD